MKKTKILFIQLPLVDHSYGYIHGNIDYAPAALSGSIKHTFGDAVTVETLPFLLANFASDAVILRYIENIRPDIISFTSYLWNIERNLDLAAKIKEKISPITIVFGGSEINPGSIALRETRKEADYFVSGEGEWFFRELLSTQNLGPYTNTINNNNLVIQPADKLIPVQDIFEPYTGKRLNSMIDGSIFLELTRGCPYRCTYCYYSKNCAGVRELPFEYLTRAIEGNTRFAGLKEIYILSPTFNKTKDFIENLKRLAKINRGKNSIRLHTEMRAAGIDTKTARLL
ncbi:MAG: radical SAM protein, partial [bacterium]|nr:radical SAM protein [bacterium]